MGPKAKPEPNDELMQMTMEQLEQEEEKLKEKRREANIKRNFVQQERVTTKFQFINFLFRI